MDSVSESDSETEVLPKKKVKKNEKTYLQKYRSEWELMPEFSKWLSRCNTSENYAFCKFCNCQIQARLATIRLHAKGSKHTSLAKNMTGSSKVSVVTGSRFFTGKLSYSLPFSYIANVIYSVENFLFNSYLSFSPRMKS